MEDPFHYPPELLQLLVDTIPRVCRAKKDVTLFFQGAGTPVSLILPWELKIAASPATVNKFEIARDLLTRLNAGGDATIRSRREVVKRIVEFEDFSTCWPSDVLQAKGLISEIRRVVNVKDSFTRLNAEREQELRKHREAREEALAATAKRKADMAALRDRLARLFAADNAQGRGKALEGVLNDLFRLSGILVREAFTRNGEPGEGVVEQIDGVVEIGGQIYLAEMKWLKDAVGVSDVASHLVRIYGRDAARGIFISASDYSAAATRACVDALAKKVVVLCSVYEILWLLENDKHLTTFLELKIQAAIVDKEPNASVLSLL